MKKLAIFLATAAVVLAPLQARATTFLDFNETNAVVTIPHSPQVEPGNTGKFTAAMWYRPENVCSNSLPRLWEKGANYMAIMGNYDNCQNSEHHRVAIEVYNGVSHTEFWGRPTRLQEGVAYHVVGTFDQDTCLAQIYIDLVPQTIHEIYPWCQKNPHTMSQNPNKPFLIGNRVGNGRQAAGDIWDFVFYNRILDVTELAGIKNGTNYPTNGLVMHLPLNEGSGTDAHDVSGNGHNGIISNAAWQSDAALQTVGITEPQGYELSGLNNNKLELTSLSLAGELSTVNAYMKTDSSAEVKAVVYSNTGVLIASSDWRTITNTSYEWVQFNIPMTVEGDYQIGVFWKQAVSGKVYLGKGNVLQARREVTTISQTPPAQVSGTLSTGPLDLFVEVWD